MENGLLEPDEVLLTVHIACARLATNSFQPNLLIKPTLYLPVKSLRLCYIAVYNRYGFPIIGANIAIQA